MAVNQITMASKKNPGRREYQQDETWTGQLQTASQIEIAVAIVADGVGGGDVGHQAASVTIDTVKRSLVNSTEPPEKFYLALARAIKEANREVYSIFGGRANSTIVISAVVEDTADSPSKYGRAFFGHVGDSVIYLVRGKPDERRLVRLNADHTIENEFHLRGEPVDDWVYTDPNNPPTSLSRAIGQKEDVEVDIGIYAAPKDSPRDFLLSDQAQRQGVKGLQLQPGDTLLLSSDGLFSQDPNVPDKRYLRDEEILDHSLEDNVDQAATTLISHGNKRGLPGTRQDNLSIALMFVPGYRRAAAAPIPRWIIATVAGLFMVGLIAFGITLFQGQQERNIQQTQQARQRVTEEFLVLINSITDTPLPTRQPTRTPTPRPTVTPLPTSTPRPTAALPDQIGLLYIGTNQREIREDQSFRFDTSAGYVAVEGLPENPVPQQANLFGELGTGLLIRDIETDPGREALEIEIAENSNVFMETGTFTVGGIAAEFSRYSDVDLSGQAPCLSVLEASSQIVFGCYGTASTCSYELGAASDAVAPGSKITFTRNDTNTGWAAPVQESLTYEDAIGYYNLITGINQTPPTCLLTLVDTDGDSLIDENDRCPDVAGSVELNGCPDGDEDGVPDIDDACPRVFGTLANGCPADSDGDGIIDDNDQCPAVPGEASNNGCPRDRDRDGLPDNQDACPDQYAEQPDGCPVPTSEPVGSR